MNHFSLAQLSRNYPDLADEVKGLSFEELLAPPKNLSTAKARFKLQRNLYLSLSGGSDISWEEAALGINPVPSFSAPTEFYAGLKIVSLPESIIAQSERSRIYALSILNHPERIKNLKGAQKTTFQKPSLAHSQALDRAEFEHKLLTFSDVAAMQPHAYSERLHRRKLLAQGPFIPTSLKKGVSVRLPIASGSMITGNPEMIAAIAMCGCLSTVYKEGLCIVPEVQADVVKRAVEILYQAIEDPLWSKHPYRRDLLNFWLCQIGITVSPDDRDAVRRVKLLLPLLKNKKLPNLAVRVYNPQVSNETLKTVARLQKEFGDTIEIFAGQANSVTAAEELIAAGADAIGQGIAGGLRCTTSIVSGVAVSVLRDLWRMRGKVNAPIFVDSSVSYYWALAYLLGASMLVKPSHINGIESVGGKFPFTDGKNYFIPYNGEASAVNKEHVGKLMKNGRPFAPEGLGGFQKIDLGLASIPDNILDTIINFLIPPFVFQGTSSGRRFQNINDMHKEADLEFLWEMSAESRKIRGAWGPFFHQR